MDNSQSSNCFSESADSSFISSLPMDTESHESLVTKTKQAFSRVGTEIDKPTFSSYFAVLLVDCYHSIKQGLDLISTLLTESDVCLDKLSEYLNDAVSLLQMFTDFIKTVTESTPMSCCSMKSFPTTTGRIIIIVFGHCKESESLYGSHLSSVEKQLKDLFRNCHELQLSYLMLLEKHFIFDLADKAERDILVEAMEINLKIGEIVQSLDMKTMAEQWKAFTIICEKYTKVLSDTNIFSTCTQVLSLLIRNNLKTALEKNQDDKVTVRSVKVASFTIKILMKTCAIFKHAIKRDHTNVVDLMLFILTSYHLESSAEKSVTNLLHTNILTPTECLLKELLSDDIFVKNFVNRDLESIKQEDTLLGYILTLTSAIKCLCVGNVKKTKARAQLIHCIYKVLPYCHVWINHDIKVKWDPHQPSSRGVFELLLVHSAALAFTLDNEEFNLLERSMADAILATDCCSALFSTDLWIIMARHFSSQLLFNQLIWLCTMYKKLETHKMFQRSPQRIHLSSVIGRLFEMMNNDDKMKICKQYRIHDDDNVSLWCALNVNNLPEEMRRPAEEAVFDKLNYQFDSFNCSKSQEDICKLIKLINLSATCSFNNIKGIEDFLVQAWLKTCPKHFTLHETNKSTVWFYHYLESLVSFTDATWLRLCEKSSNLIKVFHVISSLIQQCSVDIKLILTNMLCQLATTDICNNQLINNFIETFSCLVRDSDIIRNKLLILLMKYKHDRNIDRIICNIEDHWFQERWSNIRSGIYCNDSKEESQAMDYEYRHKCLESRIMELSGSGYVSNMKKVDSSNFDFGGDLDNLFDDSETEPVCKKVKFNMNEAEAIIERLETEVSQLCKVKENFTPNCKIRIQDVCDKLRNIID